MTSRLINHFLPDYTMSEPPWVAETQLVVFEGEVDKVEGLFNSPLICSQEYGEEIEKEQQSNEEDLNDKFLMDSLMDVLLDTERGSIEDEGLSEDSLLLLSSPENKKSREIYVRYQKFFKNYIAQDPNRNYGESTLVNFFVYIHNTLINLI